MADASCLSTGTLAGAIVGSIAGTLVLCIAAAVAIWYFVYKNEEPKKKQPVDVESRPQSTAPGTPKKSMKDQVTMIDSFKLERKSFGTQKAFSTENVNEIDGSVGVQLRADDLSGLGFDVKGNMTEGIFVKSVTPRGPADLCGNVLVEDRIRSLTISFDDMVYTDAVTLLSYASPYKVKLVLERKLEGGTESQIIDSNPALSPRVHPLFRSNTLTHCHFNPLSLEPPSRTPSPPRTEPPKLPVEVAITVEEHRKEEAEEVQAIVKVIEEEEVKEPKEIAAPVKEVEEEKKMVSSDYSSENSYKGEELLSTDSVGSVSSIEEKIEVVTARPPLPLSIAAPAPKQICEPLPPKITRQPSQVSSIPVKRTMRTAAPSPTRAAPEISEARISRIPKRADSIKTPVVERKLPPLPKSALQKREEDPAKSGDIWSRLYLEKKGALRKTRDIRSPESSLSPPPPHQSQAPAKENNNYGTLNRERRDRLTENEEILERQREELRQLGVL